MSKKAALIAFCGLVGVAASGVQCGQEHGQSRSSITGVVAQSGISPSDTAFLFLAENPLDATVAAPDGRFNLFTLHEGSATLVGADVVGFAGSTTIDLDGSVADIGVFALSPCTADLPPPENNNAGQCPDSPLSDTPPAPQLVPEFLPDTTDIALSEFPTPTLNVHAVSIGQNLALNIMLPSESQFYREGTHRIGLDASPGDPASILLFRVDEKDDLFVYRLVDGLLHVRDFDPRVGKTIRLELESAVFAWYDPLVGFVDYGVTIVIDHTGSTMAGEVFGADPSADSLSTDGSPTPTPERGVVLENMTVDYAFAQPGVDGDTTVYFDASNPDGEFASFTLTIASGVQLASYQVNNDLSGNQQGWKHDVECRVTHHTANGPVDYFLSTGLMNGFVAPVGQNMQLELSQATFYYSPNFSGVDPTIQLFLDYIFVDVLVDPSPYGADPTTSPNNAP